jgi:hypothetical protein
VRVLASTLGVTLAVVLGAPSVQAAEPSIPHLRRQGSATQLVVDGRPFLIRGGELGNSAATNPSYLEPFWPRPSSASTRSSRPSTGTSSSPRKGGSTSPPSTS